MKLTINGETRETEDRRTVHDMVATLGLTGRPVAVEVNRRLIPRAQHGDTLLSEGDRVEITTLVGGG